MEALIVPVLIVSIVFILFFSVFSSRRSRKLDSGNKPGLFKPKDIVRFIPTVLLLGFGIVGIFALRHTLDALTGLVLMAVLFISWVIFQFWQNARVLADDEEIVLCGMWGQLKGLRWQDIQGVQLISGNIVLRTEKTDVCIPGYFARQEKLLEIIRQHVSGNVE